MYSVETPDQQPDFVDSVRPKRQFASITIFADASFCPKTRAAGWGAWAKRDGWQAGRFFGGPLRREITNSTQAEVCAMASALWRLNQDALIADAHTFVIQCDNVAALAAIRRLPNSGWTRSDDRRDADLAVRRGELAPIEQEAVEAIETIAQGRPIWLRHVKGHVSGTGRNWVNRQCDAEARRHMQAVRAERLL